MGLLPINIGFKNGCNKSITATFSGFFFGSITFYLARYNLGEYSLLVSYLFLIIYLLQEYSFLSNLIPIQHSLVVIATILVSYLPGAIIFLLDTVSARIKAFFLAHFSCDPDFSCNLCSLTSISTFQRKPQRNLECHFYSAAQLMLVANALFQWNGKDLWLFLVFSMGQYMTN